MTGCSTATGFDISQLDPGIRHMVAYLRGLGFQTTDSGDGVSKPRDERAFHVPHVACAVTPKAMVREANLLFVVLGPGWTVQASYDPKDKSAVLVATKE